MVSAGRQRIEIDGTFNLRDVGGLPAGTAAVRAGKLYRSDALHRLSAASREEFRRLGIGVVIDLRAANELVTQPNNLDGLGIRTVHEPLYTTNPVDLVSSTVTLAALYRAIVDEWGANLVRVIRHIALSEEIPVLVHCTAGKDRTGLVIAFALLAAGVDEKAVVADFAATEANLAGEWTAMALERHARAGRPATPELLAIVSTSPPELIGDLIAEVEARHGSVAQYLLDNGLAPEELELLGRVLVG